MLPRVWSQERGIDSDSHWDAEIADLQELSIKPRQRAGSHRPRDCVSCCVKLGIAGQREDRVPGRGVTVLDFGGFG